LYSSEDFDDNAFLHRIKLWMTRGIASGDYII
jgi:hypothetical protein